MWIRDGIQRRAQASSGSNNLPRVSFHTLLRPPPIAALASAKSIQEFFRTCLASNTAVPILAPPALLRYQERLHLRSPVVFEHQNTGPLPQYFADEFGWEEMVREVARDEERKEQLLRPCRETARKIAP